jgi:hypothetical protein
VPAPNGGDVRRYAGLYIPTTSCHSCTPPSAPSTIRVTANEDGTLTFAGGKWTEVEPGLFVRAEGTGYIVFRGDKYVFAGGFWSWEKVGD